MASRSYPSTVRTGSARKPSKPSKPTQSGPSAAFMEQKLGIKRVKSTFQAPPPSQSKKRKVVDLTQEEEEEEEEEEEDEVAAAAAQDGLAGIEPKPKRARKKKGEEPEEKRLRRFRLKAPITYLERLERVKSQRMFLIDRKRYTSSDGTHEEEVFDIAGSTGNIYQDICSRDMSQEQQLQILPTEVIANSPLTNSHDQQGANCSCPDALKGNQCKHIVYVLVNILKASEGLAYQLAFLSTELAEIFAHAPVTPQSSDAAAQTTDTGGHRKPIEGDCPVCVMEFDESQSEDIIFCKGCCGQNIHRQCFEQWARSKPGPVKCVYCRSPWKDDEETLKRISKSGNVNAEGYVNVAGELGLSGRRDMSSYHPYWVQRQGRYGDDYGGY